MELHDITAELRDASQRLSKGATGLFKLAEASAYAEQEYRKALAHEILRLEQEGKRATLISDIARGNVAEAKFQRDLSEKKFTAGRDALRAIIAQVSALQSVLNVQKEV